MKIRDDELRIDSFNTAVATTHHGYHCAVKITHLPTNTMVQVDGKQMLKCRKEAFAKLERVLRGKSWKRIL